MSTSRARSTACGGPGPTGASGPRPAQVNDARIINTTSGSGLFGTPGQGNYGAAKAGIAGLTIIAAMELARYGVTVNAVSPIALTRMTEGLELTAGDETEQDKVDPRWISPVVAWLASERSRDVTGRVFQTSGRYWAVAQGWHRGPEATPTDDPDDAEAVLRPLLDAALPNAGPGGVYPDTAKVELRRNGWARHGSSTGCGRRGAGGRPTARSTTSTPRSCWRRCSTRCATGSGSTLTTSTTSSSATATRPATKGCASAGWRCWPPAGRWRRRASRSTASAAPASRR